MNTTTQAAPAAATLRGIGAALQSPAVKAAAVAVLLALAPLLLLRQPLVADPDLGFHLRTGDWVLQHRTVPVVETFTYSMMGKPWVAYSWLFEVLLSLLFRWFDLAGIVLYGVGMRLLLAGAMWRLISGVLPGFWRALAVTAAALYVCGVSTGPRPVLFSMLFVVIILDLVLRAERSGDTRPLWLLPIVFTLWASVHIQFVHGLSVLGAFALEPFLLRLFRQPARPALPHRRLWTLLAACSLATLVNPYGIGVWKLLWRFSQQPKFYDLISEMQAPTFRQPAHFVVLGMALAAAFALGRRRPLRPVWVMLLAFATEQGLRSSRELWFTAVIAAVVMAADWTRADEPERFTARQWLAAAACALALIAAGARFYNLNSAVLWMSVHGSFPEVAARYVESHYPQGRVFNDYNWGGFLIWRLPRMMVSIDGRSNNVHDQEHDARSLNTWRGKPGWQQDPDLVAADVVIAKSDAPLTALLRSDPRFRLVHEDREAVVFEAVH